MSRESELELFRAKLCFVTTNDIHVECVRQGWPHALPATVDAQLQERNRMIAWLFARDRVARLIRHPSAA